MDLFKIIIYCLLISGVGYKGCAFNTEKSLPAILKDINDDETNENILITDFFILNGIEYMCIYSVPVYSLNGLKGYTAWDDLFILYYGYNDSLANKHLNFKYDFYNIPIKSEDNVDIDVNPEKMSYYKIVNDSSFIRFIPDKFFLNEFDCLRIEQGVVKIPPPPPLLREGIYPFEVLTNLDTSPYFQEGKEELYCYIKKEIAKIRKEKINNQTMTIKLKISSNGKVEEAYIIHFNPEYQEELISSPILQFIPATINNVSVSSYYIFYMKG